MVNYRLTTETEADIDGILDYTIDKWGLEQAIHYQVRLESRFDQIAKNETKGRIFFADRSQYRFVRVEHHYIFYEIEEDKAPLILAIFHERMNLVERFKERLEEKA